MHTLKSLKEQDPLCDGVYLQEVRQEAGVVRRGRQRLLGAVAPALDPPGHEAGIRLEERRRGGGEEEKRSGTSVECCYHKSFNTALYSISGRSLTLAGLAVGGVK